MFARMIAVGGCTLALVVLVGSDPAGAQDKAKAKATAKVTAKAKAKFEPLNTDALFKKLDADKNAQLDAGEFSKILSVEPAPKGKKGKESEPLELPFVFKSLDANGDKSLSAEEFKGVIGAIYPNGKK